MIFYYFLSIIEILLIMIIYKNIINKSKIHPSKQVKIYILLKFKFEINPQVIHKKKGILTTKKKKK